MVTNFRPKGYYLPKQPYSRRYSSNILMPGITGPRFSFLDCGSMGQAPALFVSGQSNAGNVDTVPGSSDSRVVFTWTANGTVFNGPGPMTLQNASSNNGHSYEWQCSSDMAASFNSPILVGKTWGDGGTCNEFCRVRGAIVWPFLRNMIANFAAQCNQAGLTQVAFIWDQGSSEALTVNSALTPNLTVNTQSVFASIRALFKAYGIGRVRFYVMQQNIHFQGLPDIDNAQLASVRTQEAAIVAADPDAALINCDDITMASGYHYANGQTNTIGSRFASMIANDFTSSQPSAVVPPTIESIFGLNLLNHLNSRNGIAVPTGQVIPLWTDMSGHGRNGQSISAPTRPLYLANAQGSIPGVKYDGVIQATQIIPGTMSLPVPGVTPTWKWEITRPDGYTSGGRLWGGVGAAPALMMFGGSPNIQGYNGTFSNLAPSTLNVFNRIESYFSNSATAHTESPTGVVTGDYVKVQEALASGTNLGNTALGDLLIGVGSGNSYAAITVLDWVTCNALPTKAQFDALCGYYTFNYGTGVGIT